MPNRMEKTKMDYARLREILELKEDINSAKRRELLRIYLQTPTLPKLQAVRALLVEIKKTLNCCPASRQKCLKKIRRIMCHRH